MANSLKRLRTLTLALLIMAFFIGLTIFLILLIQGKKITSTGEIIDTGIIRIESLPDNLEAFIDGEEVNISSKQIREVNLGLVDLTLTKDGYTEWTKSLTLEKNQVENIYAQIYPEEPITPELVTDLNISRVYFPEGSSKIYYLVLNADNAENNGLWELETDPSIFNINKGEPKHIVTFSDELLTNLRQESFGRDGQFNFQFSKDGGKALLLFPENKIYIIDLDDKQALPTDLTLTLGFYPDSIEWFKGSRTVVIKEENILYEFNLITEESDVIYFNPVGKFNYTVSDQVVYLWDDSNSVLKKYENNNSRDLKLQGTIDIQSTDVELFAAKGNKDILVIQTPEELYYFDFKENFEKLIELGGKFIKMSSNGKTVIYENVSGLQSFIVNDRIDKNDEVTNYEVRDLKNIQNDISKFDFKFSSKGLTLITQEYAESASEGQGSLILSDRDGENPYILINEASFIVENTYLSNDNKTLYVLINEEPPLVLDASEGVKKLYKYSLILEN